MLIKYLNPSYQSNSFSHRFGHRVFQLWVAIALIITIFITISPQPVEAKLPANSAIKDSRILLRNALPIKNELIREVQTTLEAQPRQANLKRWNSIAKDLKRVKTILAQDQQKLLANVTDQAAGLENLKKLNDALTPLEEAITNKERNKVKPLVEQALEYVGNLEALMVTQFPFTVPEAYAHLPQLKGRATVELETSKGTITIVLDGYNAPVNAGQFADLVQRGFYDGLSFNRADDDYFLQAGDPPGAADGFIDPNTGKVRTVPMEVKIPDKEVPFYGFTLSDLGLARTLPVLPFSAFGTIAMAHPAEDVNGGSSQFFLYLFESDLTPAGLNLIDGNYAAFGYLKDGTEVLRKLKLGDKIISAKIIEGAENLVQPAA
ncbi:peptidyl-prolyl cis-trans isomerase (rotamase) - cyclophilin family [Synechococcus sp. PCC 7502]|uniref:peptidylprolyl isomerase n=1 Tax=Synechococcus sp. PCC 7502 TaxID=1173263 RepID=UPI00029FA71A|nr:peptidylprolyl isomerase [Synechococcus sp. PCC 7502]AFY74007.1 peptidyl-prolyl cis-trans isomerase (rotamase) - cyclophilin family [Synechococcus sp. PCC 7502]